VSFHSVGGTRHSNKATGSPLGLRVPAIEQPASIGGCDRARRNQLRKKDRYITNDVATPTRPLASEPLRVAATRRERTGQGGVD
jgi:hypothetical protein